MSSRKNEGPTAASGRSVDQCRRKGRLLLATPPAHDIRHAHAAAIFGSGAGVKPDFNVIPLQTHYPNSTQCFPLVDLRRSAERLHEFYRHGKSVSGEGMQSRACGRCQRFTWSDEREFLMKAHAPPHLSLAHEGEQS